MKIEILHSPGAAAAHVALEPGEELTAESGAMICMSGDMNVSTAIKQRGKGLMAGLRRMLSGESLFLNTFRPSQQGGEVYLAPTLVGDVIVYQMRDGLNLVVQGSSYLASALGVHLDLGWKGFKSFFSGESVFWIDVSGRGPVLLNAFGAVYEIDVDGEYTVDTGHIVAFEQSLDFKVTKAGRGWIGSFLGGEGLVCRFKGKGKVFCQTHNPPAFGRTVGPKLPPR
ncbi:TIGR00266 family protein [Leptolyngbya sp. FACHB-261]|uniref:TIGR00266 family protein n=1 Tax=Leptolyngbya sp. FACHB-261 TaxID=2692806 RepID=UPI0016887FAB|nr:TIGR00266 family protein [Leptolyngbya sp. FACHB-261]MBD2102456.1 TIGR00266 family protein [Leptolyngbya sp. FACHB-261]